MNRQQFLERLNRRSRARYGVTLTDRMLRDSVEEGIIAGPKPRGRRRGQSPEWVWARGSYRQALQICRLKALGCVRFGDLRVQLWLRGSEPASGDFRASLRAEFVRRQKEAFRRVNVTRDPRTDEGAHKGRSGLTRQIGQPSPSLLPAGVEIAPIIKIAAFDAMRFGEARSTLASATQSFLENNFKEFLFVEEFGKLFPDQVIGFFINGLNKSMADPDEVEASVIDVIQSAPPLLFDNARYLLKIIVTALRSMSPLAELASAFGMPLNQLVEPSRFISAVLQRQPVWKMMLFVFCLNVIHNSDDQGQELADQAREIEQIIIQIRTQFFKTNAGDV